MIRLFCKRALQKERYSAKETYNLYVMSAWGSHAKHAPHTSMTPKWSCLPLTILLNKHRFISHALHALHMEMTRHWNVTNSMICLKITNSIRRHIASHLWQTTHSYSSTRVRLQITILPTPVWKFSWGECDDKSHAEWVYGRIHVCMLSRSRLSRSPSTHPPKPRHRRRAPSRYPRRWRKRAMYLHKRAIYFRRRAVYPVKEPYISAEEPYIL